MRGLSSAHASAFFVGTLAPLSDSDSFAQSQASRDDASGATGLQSVEDDSRKRSQLIGLPNGKLVNYLDQQVVLTTKTIQLRPHSLQVKTVAYHTTVYFLHGPLLMVKPPLLKL